MLSCDDTPITSADAEPRAGRHRSELVPHGRPRSGGILLPGALQRRSREPGRHCPCEILLHHKAFPSISTTVFDGATDEPWSGTEVTGATAFDTATVTGVTGFTPTGSVRFTFYNNGRCSGDGSAHVSTLSNGSAQSLTTQPLAPGSYSYRAVYFGDDNYFPSNPDHPVCETFTVTKATPPVATTVFDGSTHGPWAGDETTGATAYDTATVTGVTTPPPPELVTPAATPAVALPRFTPTGTVTYQFFTSGNCSGDPSWTDTVNLSAGAVPPSDTTDPLGGGDYFFDAVYSGDANYTTNTSSCEPFTVDPADPGTSTTVFDGSTHAAWAGTEVTGATAYDTSTVTGVEGFTPTGTVTYTLFDNGTCAVPDELGAPATPACRRMR